MSRRCPAEVSVVQTRHDETPRHELVRQERPPGFIVDDPHSARHKHDHGSAFTPGVAVRVGDEGTRDHRPPTSALVRAPAGEVEVEAIAWVRAVLDVAHDLRRGKENAGARRGELLERDDASGSRGPMGGRHGADGALKNRDRDASANTVGRGEGAHLLVRVVHPRDAEERGGEEGGKSHETKEFEQPSDPERRESERTGVNLDGWNVGRDTRETTGRGSTRAPEEGCEAHGEPEGHHDVSTDRGDERGRAFEKRAIPTRRSTRAEECQRPMLTSATTMSSGDISRLVRTILFLSQCRAHSHVRAGRRVLESGFQS